MKHFLYHYFFFEPIFLPKPKFVKQCRYTCFPNNVLDILWEYYTLQFKSDFHNDEGLIIKKEGIISPFVINLPESHHHIYRIGPEICAYSGVYGKLNIFFKKVLCQNCLQ